MICKIKPRRDTAADNHSRPPQMGCNGGERGAMAFERIQQCRCTVLVLDRACNLGPAMIAACGTEKKAPPLLFVSRRSGCEMKSQRKACKRQSGLAESFWIISIGIIAQMASGMHTEKIVGSRGNPDGSSSIAKDGLHRRQLRETFGCGNTFCIIVVHVIPN